MARRPQYVPATPEVLEWARNERQMSLREAADALELTTAELTAIEEGQRPPTADVLRAMMRVYGRSESILLLPVPPPPAPQVTDRRSAGRREGAPELGTIRALREGRLVQGLVSELLAEDRELLPRAQIVAATEEDDPEEIARDERRRLRATIELQRSWKAGGPSLTGWRALLQAHGVIVLSKDIPRDDCRGVALTGDGLVPLIIVTTDDSYAGRIFTLFHEYGHLIRRSASYCAVGFQEAEELERWCDRFSAAFLMPRADVERLLTTQRFRSLEPGDWTLSDIERGASWFRVSPFAFARRLSDLGLSTFYRRHLRELWERDRRARRAPRPDQSAGVPSPVAAVREFGTAAGGAILEALHRGLVDRSEFVSATGVRGDQIGDFEKHLAEQRMRESA